MKLRLVNRPDPQSATAGCQRAGMLLVCIAAIALIANYRCPPVAADPPGGTSGWTQTFDDNFPGGGLNTNTWIPWSTYTENNVLLPSPNYNPSPYAADAYYVPTNQSVGSNLLTEQAQSGDNLPPGGGSGSLPYSSAWIATNNFQQTYGYFECDMDAQITQGDDTGFWMLSRGIWPPEIDIAEFPGASSIYWDGVQENSQGYGYDGNAISSSGSDGPWYAFPSGENSGWAYHTYGVDWEPTYISWYIDGNLVYTTTDTSVIPNVPMYMQLSMQLESDLSGGDWFGQASSGTWPDYTYVAWVKAWLKNDSSLSAPTGVSATAGNPWVTVSWSPSSGATCYNVYRGTTSGGESPSAVATDVTSTSFTDTNIAGGTEYYYEVAAVDTSGSSAMSSEVSATPTSSTSWVTGETLGTSRSNFTGWVGCEFTTGSSPVTLTQLGRWVESGDTTAHMVKLVLASDGSDVPGGEVMVNTAGQATGQFCYMPLQYPLVLPADTTYYLVSTEESGSDAWYDSNTSLTTTSAATLNGAIFYNGSAWTSAGGAGNSYVPVAFTYGGSGIIASGTYYLVCNCSGLGLDDPSGGGSGTGLDQQSATGLDQQWVVTAVGDGEYEITSAANGLAVTDAATYSQLTLASYSGTPDQLWSFVSDGSYYNIVNEATGEVLNDWENSTSPGNTIGSWPNTATSNEQWSLTPSSTAIAYVQGAANGGSSSASAQSVTLPSAQAAGDMNVVIIGSDPTLSVSSVTDSAGNTYQLADAPTSYGDTDCAIYYASNINASSSNTVTVTYNGTMSWPDFEVMEFSGVSSLDQTATSTGDSASPATGNVTTTAADELLIGGCCDDQLLSAPGSGYTFGPNDSFGYGGEYEIVNSTGSYSAGMSLTASGDWVMQMATFK